MVVSAQNEVGLSMQSEYSGNQEVRMITKLPATFALKSLGSTKDSVKLRWDFFPDHRSMVNYDIYQALEVGPFRMIKSTKDFSYTVSKLSSGVTYRFKISAYNACGKSESREMSVRVSGVPKQMNPVNTIPMGCSVQFEWDPYYHNGGFPITATKIEVQTKSGLEIVHKCSKAADSNSCEVKMSLLAGAPFFLKPGDSIQDKVQVSAKNEVGWSLVSRPNLAEKPVMMVKAPAPITNLVVTQTGKDHATLTWDDFKDQRYDIY